MAVGGRSILASITTYLAYAGSDRREPHELILLEGHRCLSPGVAPSGHLTLGGSRASLLGDLRGFLLGPGPC